jgi:hypothetical protein
MLFAGIKFCGDRKIRHSNSYVGPSVQEHPGDAALCPHAQQRAGPQAVPVNSSTPVEVFGPELPVFQSDSHSLRSFRPEGCRTERHRDKSISAIPISACFFRRKPPPRRRRSGIAWSKPVVGFWRTENSDHHYGRGWTISCKYSTCRAQVAATRAYETPTGRQHLFAGGQSQRADPTSSRSACAFGQLRAN